MLDKFNIEDILDDLTKEICPFLSLEERSYQAISTILLTGSDHEFKKFQDVIETANSQESASGANIGLKFRLLVGSNASDSGAGSKNLGFGNVSIRQQLPWVLITDG